MNIIVSWDYIVFAAVAAVGIMEWAKGFPALKVVPGWAWRLVLAAVCVGVAYLGADSWGQRGTNAAALLAVAQIGYPLLVQLPGSFIEAARKKVTG